MHICKEANPLTLQCVCGYIGGLPMAFKVVCKLQKLCKSPSPLQQNVCRLQLSS